MGYENRETYLIYLKHCISAAGRYINGWLCLGRGNNGNLSNYYFSSYPVKGIMNL